jgi:hypothetical protein
MILFLRQRFSDYFVIEFKIMEETDRFGNDMKAKFWVKTIFLIQE